MHIHISIWGSKKLIEAIADNYYHPRALNDHSFKESFTKLVPQPVIATNYHIGTVCSILPIVSNMFLVDDELLSSNQHLMPIPDGYGYDINLKNRASESYSIEILPHLSSTAYADFMVDIKISINNLYIDDLIEHFKQVITCISSDHCFAWHVLARLPAPYFRQILNISRPAMLTLSEGSHLECVNSDNVIFSLTEFLVLDPENSELDTIKAIAEKYGQDSVEAAVSEGFIRRHYWPSDITPLPLRENVCDFFQQIYPYEYDLVFEEHPVYSFVSESPA